jgi:hypothetical protein
MLSQTPIRIMCRLEHRATEVDHGAFVTSIALSAVLRYEHAKVDEPCSRVELRVDGVDAESILVARSGWDDVDENVADNRL